MLDWQLNFNKIWNRNFQSVRPQWRRLAKAIFYWKKRKFKFHSTQINVNFIFISEMDFNYKTNSLQRKAEFESFERNGRMSEFIRMDSFKPLRTVDVFSHKSPQPTHTTILTYHQICLLSHHHIVHTTLAFAPESLVNNGVVVFVFGSFYLANRITT